MQTVREEKSRGNGSLKPHKFYIALGKKQSLSHCCSICFYCGTTPVTYSDFIRPSYGIF